MIIKKDLHSLSNFSFWTVCSECKLFSDNTKFFVVTKIIRLSRLVIEVRRKCNTCFYLKERFHGRFFRLLFHYDTPGYFLISYRLLFSVF